MTNRQRQKDIDKQKWEDGVRFGYDPSGLLAMCNYCPKQYHICKCSATQEEREAQCLCAKAYNKMRRACK